MTSSRLAENHKAEAHASPKPCNNCQWAGQVCGGTHASQQRLLAGDVRTGQHVQPAFPELGLAVALQAGSAEIVGARSWVQAMLARHILQAYSAHPNTGLGKK